MTIPNMNFRTCIPFYILLDKNLSANEIRLYGLIEQMENVTGNVFFTNKHLSEILVVTIRAIQQMSKKLNNAGYITRAFNVEKKKYMWQTKKPSGLLEGGEAVLHGGVKLYFMGGGEAVLHPVINKRLNNKNSNFSESFPFEKLEEKLYKKTMLKKAKTLWSKLTADEQKLILDDYPKRYATWQKQFVHNPAEYLSEEMWKDEIIHKNGQNQAKVMPISDAKPVLTTEQYEEMTSKEHEKRIERMKSKIGSSYMGSQNRLTAKPEKALKSIKTYLMEARNDSQQP